VEGVWNGRAQRDGGGDLIKQASEADKVAPDMAEVEARLKRFQSQFPDEAAFKQRLAANGTSLEAMRARTEEQVLLESWSRRPRPSRSPTRRPRYFSTRTRRSSRPPRP